MKLNMHGAKSEAIIEVFPFILSFNFRYSFSFRTTPPTEQKALHLPHMNVFFFFRKDAALVPDY